MSEESEQGRASGGGGYQGGLFLFIVVRKCLWKGVWMCRINISRMSTFNDGMLARKPRSENKRMLLLEHRDNNASELLCGGKSKFGIHI